MSADHLLPFSYLSDGVTNEIDNNQFFNESRFSSYEPLTFSSSGSSLFLREDCDLPYLSPNSPGDSNDPTDSSSSSVSESTDHVLQPQLPNSPPALSPAMHPINPPVPLMLDDAAVTTSSAAHTLFVSPLLAAMPARAAPQPLSFLPTPMVPADMNAVNTTSSRRAPVMVPGVAPPVNHHKKHELKISTSKPLVAKIESSSSSSSPISNSSSRGHSVSASVPVPAPGASSVDNDTIRELLKEQSVKKQRLARKAELARISRKRKKTRLCDLEGEVAKLKEELERERKQRKLAQECLAAAQQQQAQQQHLLQQRAPEPESTAAPMDLAEETKAAIEAVRRALQNSSSSSSSSSSGSPAVLKAVTDTVNLIKKRVNHGPSQLQAAQRAMNPSLQVKFLEWALSQKDSFYSLESDGLWNSLFVRELGLSNDQLNGIMAIRAAMAQQRSAHQDVQNALAQLSMATQSHVAATQSNLDKFVSMFTPEQLGKFFTWVDSYGSICVQINV